MKREQKRRGLFSGGGTGDWQWRLAFRGRGERGHRKEIGSGGELVSTCRVKDSSAGCISLRNFRVQTDMAL